MCVGLAQDYASFLLFRLAISVIGASFVITQFHTSVMFVPALKGTANAVAGGWGNLGGGVTNMTMPLIFTIIVGFGYTSAEAWRYAMIIPGALMLIMAFLYYRYTKDTPAGNYDEINRERTVKATTDYTVLKDWRIWALSLAYAVCFGMEITFDNIAALHFVQEYHLSQGSAGFWAGAFGLMNIFARAMGGVFADRVGMRYGLKGKGLLLAAVLLLEGIGLMLFATAGSFGMAILFMILFALFLKMANGATYAITPFINKNNVGLVSGIVGAGGNVGGMLFGFLFKSNDITYAEAFHHIGLIVIAVSAIVFITKFSKTQRSGSPAKTIKTVLIKNA
jgi:NNP family nitrate/nitrite transporter-like MFS transporter